MQEPDGTLVTASAFLLAAERFHLATRLDRYVLRRVIDWMENAAFLDGIDVLTVNLSGQSIGDQAFHRWAANVLDATGEKVCTRLCCEVTETAAVTTLADATVFIDQMHKLRVRMALDDFGAEAASFGYLKS